MHHRDIKENLGLAKHKQKVAKFTPKGTMWIMWQTNWPKGTTRLNNLCPNTNRPLKNDKFTPREPLEARNLRPNINKPLKNEKFMPRVPHEVRNLLLNVHINHMLGFLLFCVFWLVLILCLGLIEPSFHMFRYSVSRITCFTCLNW